MALNRMRLTSGKSDGYTRRNPGMGVTKELLHYKNLLNQARGDPENYSMPICHRHIGMLASSIHKRELSDTVIVLVPPGRDANRTKQVGCFLCYRYPA